MTAQPRSSHGGGSAHALGTRSDRKQRQLETSCLWLSTGSRAKQALVAVFLAGCGTKSGHAPQAADDAADAADSDVPTAASAAPAAAVGPPACDRGDDDPKDLRCTGLYRDFDARELARGVREYRPAFELWSDGAAKTRWIYLPPGSKIDISRSNDWVFPLGTKLWKEFRLPAASGRERRIETRLLWKTAEDRWTRAVYAWSTDETQALQVKDGVAPVLGTDGYAIPAQVDCIRCHAGKIDSVLGFEAIQLAAPEASGFTYDELLRLDLLETKSGDAPPPAAQLRVPGNEVERRALGLLHANCGVSCHHPLGVATHFEMRLEIVDGGRALDAKDTRVYATAINRPSKLQPAGTPPGRPYYRIRPLDPDRSAIVRSMSRRDPPGDGAAREQMPPLATRRIDEAGIAAIRAWIASMTPAAGYPRPAP